MGLVAQSQLALKFSLYNAGFKKTFSNTPHRVLCYSRSFLTLNIK